MDAIDGMDILGYWKVKSWSANRKNKPKPSYIDKVWPGQQANI